MSSLETYCAATVTDESRKKNAVSIPVDKLWGTLLCKVLIVNL